MQYTVDIGSVTAEVKENSLVIWSNSPFRVLSSGVLNGGFKEADAIVNVQVSENCGSNENDEHWNAEEFLRKHVIKLALPEGRTVGMMTAAKMQNVAISRQRLREAKITVFVTAGTSIAATAGDPTASTRDQISPRRCGTINIIALVDGNLTQSCMVDAVKTITEAKTVALKELDVRSHFSGELASGTITDSVAVACTGNGIPIRYAGTFTALGELLGKSVREAVKEAILKQDRLRPDRPLSKRLEERGITFEEIVRLASNSKPDECNEEEIQLVRMPMQELLSDQKIASLVMASLRIDEDHKLDLIPKNQSAEPLRETTFLRIAQNAMQAYVENEDEADSIHNSLRANDEANRKLGHLARVVLSAVFQEALSRSAKQ